VISDKMVRSAMVVLTPLWEANPVEYLVQWKFPETIAFGSFQARKRSSYTPGQWQEIQHRAEAYRRELRALPEAEFDALVKEARETEKERYDAFREEQERNQVFNQPHASADFLHWASASYWTLDEATSLSLSKDPRVVTWEVVSPHRHISAFAKAFEARRDLLLRAATMGQLAQQTAPFVVLAWADRMRIPMPEPLADAVRAIGFQIADWKTLHDRMASAVEHLQAQLKGKDDEHAATVESHARYVEKMREGQDRLAALNESIVAHKDAMIEHLTQSNGALSKQIEDLQSGLPASPAEKSLASRERESLLKLVIGMAIKGYGFDPKAARSSIAREIADDLARVGLPLDEDTVRKYIAEAKAQLRRDETE
jgi:hypothetical protein